MTALPFRPVFFGLNEQILVHGRFRAAEPALIEGSRCLDWREYNERGNRIGHALRRLSVKPGDRVATLVPNGLWAHELLLGVWRAGAVLVPLSPLLAEENLDTMLADCGARLLLADPAFAERTARLRAALPRLGPAELAEACVATDTQPPAVARGADDLAVIIYSSGTTGVPKGIAHSHGSRRAFAAYFAAEFAFTPHTRTVSCVPIHSNGAWLSWAAAKWMGATTVILPHFSSAAYIYAIRKHAPTHGFIAPTMARALLADPELPRVGLRGFRTLITAGSPMPGVDKAALQRLSDHHLYELWGLTEGVATIIGPEDMRTHPHSVGRPMSACDIRLIDADGNDVTGTDSGEIVGRSAQMMSGYWNRPDANEAVLWHAPDGTPYLRTGDVGEFDEAGFLTLRGRLKDMFISGGFNVYPADIEAVLLRHPDIGETSVMGVPSRKWGESAVAFVRLREDAGASAEALRGWANARLAKPQRLAELHVVPEPFPHNSMGKVVKRDLLARWRPDGGSAP